MPLGPDQPTGDLTISAWVKTSAAVGDIVSKYDWLAGERAFVFGVGGEGEKEQRPGHLFAWISSAGKTFTGATIESPVAVNDGRWHHVALVFAAGKSMTLFVDGEDVLAPVQGVVPKSIARSDRGLAVGAGYRQSRQPGAFAFDGRLADVRLYGRALSDAEVFRSAVDGARSARSGAGQAAATEAITALFARSDDELVRRRLAIADLRSRIERLRSEVMETAVMEELPEPRPTYVLLRGDFQHRGERVRPKLPALFAETSSTEPRDRLEFARWLVSPRNPLTARVTVNRIWQALFGSGLVSTGADFGRHGELPSHPRLLDWLAAELLESGWSVKRVIRAIVLSDTYAQSSVHNARGAQRDPRNRLLWRMNRRRLPAEQIRDAALAAAGRLDRRVGGASAFPPQPPGIWEERGQSDAGNSAMTWVDSHGRDRFRRGMYTFWKRMSHYPSFAMFDAPTRQRCIVERAVTNTPLQALVTLNDEAFVEAARFLAERVLRRAATDHDRLSDAFRLVLGRPPTEVEVERFSAFLNTQRRRFTGDDEAAAKFVSLQQNASSRAEGPTVAERAAWTQVASVLLNLDEAINIE